MTGSVLLKNEFVDGEAVLPLSPSIRRLAVIGRLADQPNTGDHGSSLVQPPSTVSALQGLREALPTVDVIHCDGRDRRPALEPHPMRTSLSWSRGWAPRMRANASLRRRPRSGAVRFSLHPAPRAICAWQDHRQGRGIVQPVRSRRRPQVAHVAQRGRSTHRVGGRRESADRSGADRRKRHPHGGVARQGAGDPPRLVSGNGRRPSARGCSHRRRRTRGTAARCHSRSCGTPSLLRRRRAKHRLRRLVGSAKLDRDGNPAAFPFGFGLGYTTFDIALLDHRAGDTDGLATVRVTNTGSRAGSTVVQMYAFDGEYHGQCRS